MADQFVQTNIGLLPYDAIVAQINARYAEGKTPDLAVKSALQLGIDPAIIATLPGVDANAMRRGMQLISSGAFSEQASGTQADIQQAAPVGSAQYNARISAGLDAFGFPAEEVRRLTAAGLYGAGKQFDPGDMGQPGLLSEAGENRFSGLFASPDVLAEKAQEVLAQSGKANDPRFADAIVGSFTQNGISYNVQGDGSIQGVIETPTGAYLAAGFTPSGQQATEQLSTQFEQTSTDRLLGTLANAAIAAGTAAGLGPAGVGFLSTPAAAAVGAGTTSFANSGDLAQALRAAALGGAAAFGIEQLFPTAIQTAANTAVDLAGTGASQTEIVNALVDQGVRAGTAAQMAGDALAGATARQIATEFASSSIGGTAAGATSLAPNLVEVATSTAAPGLLATAAPSLAGAGLGAATTGLLGNTANQSVNLDVSRNATGDTTAPTAGLLGATPGTITSQSVPLDVTRTATTTNQAPSTGAAVGSITSQSVPLDVSRGTTTTQTTAPSTGAAVGTLTPMQSVPVESRTIKTETPSILAPAAATVITTPRGEVPVTTYEVPRSSTGPIEGSTTINPLLALGLLGLAGTALGGGSTAAPFDQAAYDAIAKGRSPVYPRGQFTPISLGGLPGMGGVGGIPGAYDYFGPYYGAGRFGARPQAFALPGLLGPTMGTMSIPTTPSRSAAV
jgi:hypothetical protein